MSTIAYEVLTEEEMNQERGILRPGFYPAEIVSAEPKTSKTSGNPMVELKVKVWDDAGRVTTLFDYIVFTRKMAWKIKHFWESAGKPEKYDGAFRCDDAMGLSCFLETALEEGDKGQRAKIKDYITEEEYKKAKADEATVNQKIAASKADDFDDEVPF